MFTLKQRVSLANFPTVHGTITELNPHGSAQVQWDGGNVLWYMSPTESLTPIAFPRNAQVAAPNGTRRRVIEEVGTLRFISAAIDEANPKTAYMPELLLTEEAMRISGYMEVTQATQPEPASRTVSSSLPTQPQSIQPSPANTAYWPVHGNTYHYFGPFASICSAVWSNSPVDVARRDSFGVYPSEQDALAARGRFLLSNQS